MAFLILSYAASVISVSVPLGIPCMRMCPLLQGQGDLLIFFLDVLFLRNQPQLPKV